MTSSASLIGLPDEILLTIARAVNTFDDPNSALCNLALTNRRFTEIAREVLIRNALVPRHGVYEHIALLQKQPKWAQRVEQLEVYGCKPLPLIAPGQLWLPSALSQIFAPHNTEEAQELR